LKKVILCPNTSRPESLEMAVKTAAMLSTGPSRTVLCPIYTDGGENFTPPADLPVSELSRELEGAGLIVVFGGDGTILRAARVSAGTEVPILGVNAGTIGFMAELEQEELWLIPSVITGDFPTEERMLLDYCLERAGQTVVTGYAINEIVIGSIMKVADLRVSGDGHEISRITGDGVIIATPTGSTAYSMSAGGPIVEPTAENIVITPVCAHALAARSFVLTPERTVTVEYGLARTNAGYLSVDGAESCQVLPGDRLTVRKSRKTVRFVDASERTFYDRVFEKLGNRRFT
jgi:NAD+ kinase